MSSSELHPQCRPRGEQKPLYKETPIVRFPSRPPSEFVSLADIRARLSFAGQKSSAFGQNCQ